MLAENLGFDALWLNEEHFQGSVLEIEGRRCLSPLILASAILARTRRLRVGFSVLLLALHHPVRLAEEISTLDVLSGGRVDFGISRGGNRRYLTAYGVAEDDVDKRFHTNLDLILRAWKDSPADINGSLQSVEPKPVQRPHPPIFIGTYTNSTVTWAVRRGYSLICHGIASLHHSRRLLREFGDAGGEVAQVPFGRFLYVSETDASARHELWPAILKLTARLNSISPSGRAAFLHDDDLQPETFYREMVIAGGPETCVERIESLRSELGIGYLNAQSAFFGFLPLPLLRQSLHLLALEVRPKLSAHPLAFPV